MSQFILEPPANVVEEVIDLESVDKGCEVYDGRLERVEVSALSSHVGMAIGHLLFDHCRSTKSGHVFGPDCGFIRIGGARGQLRRPDVSVIRSDRFTLEQLQETNLVAIAPDLAVEVISPTDLAGRLNRKVGEYLDAGVRLVWVVDPVLRNVVVFRPDGTAHRLGASAAISGEDALPGFGCAVSEFFP